MLLLSKVICSEMPSPSLLYYGICALWGRTFVLFADSEHLYGVHFLCGRIEDHVQWGEKRFKNCLFVLSQTIVAPWVQQMERGESVRVALVGTDFQKRVWRRLTEVPRGAVCTYGELATACGMARSARAVGNAVGANFVACLIPCHRVVRKGGLLGGYRWGTEAKGWLLEQERAVGPPGLEPGASSL